MLKPGLQGSWVHPSEQIAVVTGGFGPESSRPWVVSANFSGSFQPDFFANPEASWIEQWA